MKQLAWNMGQTASDVYSHLSSSLCPLRRHSYVRNEKLEAGDFRCNFVDELGWCHLNKFAKQPIFLPRKVGCQFQGAIPANLAEAMHRREHHSRRLPREPSRARSHRFYIPEGLSTIDIVQVITDVAVQSSQIRDVAFSWIVRFATFNMSHRFDCPRSGRNIWGKKRVATFSSHNVVPDRLLN